VLRHIRLLVRPETVLRWHRDLIAAPSRPHLTPEPGRPATHGALHPHAGTASGPREQLMGIPAHPR
jgi:hypothetical protein